jgi:hypothetical protein
VNALFGDLVADLLYPMRHIFMLEDGWSDIQSILDLGRFENWQSMTMTAVCAHDDASLVEPLFKQQFSEHPLRTGLPSRHMSGGRLTMTDTCDRMATASFGRLFAGEAE